MSASNPVTSRPMGSEAPFAAGRFSPALRIVLIVVGSGLLVLLGTAACLTPARQGMGTHQQLGLPPCSLVQWFGIRCPSCGMTTSWSYVMHGNVWRACGVNSGGTLLALVSLLAGPWMLATGLWGRHIFAPPPLEWIAGTSLTIGLVTLIDWCIRLSR